MLLIMPSLLPHVAPKRPPKHAAPPNPPSNCSVPIAHGPTGPAVMVPAAIIPPPMTPPATVAPPAPGSQGPRCSSVSCSCSLLRHDSLGCCSLTCFLVSRASVWVALSNCWELLRSSLVCSSSALASVSSSRSCFSIEVSELQHATRNTQEGAKRVRKEGRFCLCRLSASRALPTLAIRGQVGGGCGVTRDWKNSWCIRRRHIRKGLAACAAACGTRGASEP